MGHDERVLDLADDAPEEGLAAGPRLTLAEQRGLARVAAFEAPGRRRPAEPPPGTTAGPLVARDRAAHPTAGAASSWRSAARTAVEEHAVGPEARKRTQVLAGSTSTSTSPGIRVEGDGGQRELAPELGPEGLEESLG